MSLSQADISALLLSMKLGLVSTFLTLLIGTPLAWWLSRGQGIVRRVIGAVATMPIVLPPTVLGFYLLVLLGPRGPIGQAFEAFGLRLLPFTFSGLVFASIISSLPFVVQPLQNSFEALGERPLEAAATLGAGQLDAFLTVILPQARPAFLTAAVMAFSHTIGEFGVVLMIGGNIPDVTRVLSLQIYVYVEMGRYGNAHALSAILMVFAILSTLLVQLLNPKNAMAVLRPRSPRKA
ncbi:MAG: molybdate ABC transporter permease subunit [Deltaproteobacteria bacterium]|jgi:molybdate transport system permease protein|nr:molybdate ABC transporter permease subunit [Deltaproteobacteria bacterium]